MIQQVKILGVKIWDISFSQAKEMIGEFLKGQKQNLIVTPNPEILLEAYKNKVYQNCLNTADLALPDGFVLRLFSKLKHTVTGVDITAEILKMANSQQLAVLCIVRQDGLSSLAMVVDAGKKLAPQARFLGWEVSKKDSLISNEANFQNFLAKNLFLIEHDLTLYVDEEINGVEFPVGNRFIDILAVDKNKNYVVIELKVSRGYDRVVGQILRYMAWIRKNHAENHQKVRGIIIVREITDDLLLACSETNNVELYEYNLSVTLKKIDK